MSKVNLIPQCWKDQEEINPTSSDLANLPDLHTFEPNTQKKEFVCTCNFHAPPERVIRSPLFNKGLAQYWLGKNLGAPALIDQLSIELLDHYTGQLFWNGKKIDLFAVDLGSGDDWIDAAFGDDPSRDISNFLERGYGNFKNRLDAKLMHRSLLLHFAREIAECRLRFHPVQPEKSAD